MRPATIDTRFRATATVSGGFVGLVALLYYDFPQFPIR
jgi:hypothetical protein